MSIEKFCDMCGQYYHDPNKHQYVDCVYRNGCPCGLKNVPKRHTESCFYWRDKKRREEADRSRSAASSAGVTTSYSNTECSLCGAPYYYSYEAHKSSCYYHQGCPSCRQAYKPRDHYKTCRETPAYPYQGAYRDPWLEPRSLCTSCGEYIINKYYMEHQNRCKRERDEAREEAKAAAKPSPSANEMACPLCDQLVARSGIIAHQEVCMEDIRKKFAEKPMGSVQMAHREGTPEPALPERKVAPVAAGDRVVEFPQEGS